MQFSSLRFELYEDEPAFERTLPLPLKPHVSDLLFQGFADEMDAAVVARLQKRANARKFTAIGFALVLVITLVLFFMQSNFSPASFSQVGGFTVLIAFCLSCVALVFGPCITLSVTSARANRALAIDFQNVCAQFTRTCGEAITFHYMEEALQEGEEVRKVPFVEVHYPRTPVVRPAEARVLQDAASTNNNDGVLHV